MLEKGDLSSLISGTGGKKMSKYDADLETDKKTFSGKILNLIKKNSRILEFGPASGRFTKYLKENMGCDVHIIEINREDFNEAMQYASDGLCSDIETMEWQEYFKGNKYDHIIFADVLEHLRNPQKIFNVCADFIKDDGSLIFSIPNAAHGDIIANIYNNDFKYTELGLLDNTHIHLFAYKNIMEMIEKSQLKLTKLDAVYIPLKYTEQQPIYNNDVLYNIINEKKYADVYQFVGECKKTGKLENHCLIEDYMTVYLSSDGIFTEQNKININLESCNNRYEINIENLEKDIKHLRIYPVENKYIIIENVKTVGCSDIVSHNGIEYQGQIFFNTLEPSFIIDVMNTKKVTIYFDMKVYAFSDILEFYDKISKIYILINDELKNKNTEYSMQISSQYNIIENFNNTISELIKHNDMQHERIMQQDKEIVNLSATIEELNKHNNAQHERMMQQEKDIINLSTTVDELNKHNNAQHERITQQEKDIINLSTTVDELNKHNNAQHERITQQEKEINKLYDSINKLKMKENEQNNIILDKEMQNNALNQQIDEKIKMLDELQFKLDNTENLLYKIENSKSWKITKPLRSIARIFKHGREI